MNFDDVLSNMKKQNTKIILEKENFRAKLKKIAEAYEGKDEEMCEKVLFVVSVIEKEIRTHEEVLEMISRKGGGKNDENAYRRN
jgi:hypothetical protein